MAIITFLESRKEPREDCQHAYDVLTGRSKPFYIVFGRTVTEDEVPEGFTLPPKIPEDSKEGK